MMLARLVVVGGLASLYGIMWAMCICDIGVMVGLLVLSFVSVYVFYCFHRYMYVCGFLTW